MNSCDRMTDAQVAKLALAICATAEILGHTLSAEAAELMAEDLSGHSATAVADALRACRRELTGKLSLAAILQRVQRADGRPEPDEAWAIALQAGDEQQTVVMTEEINLALAAARPVLSAGDKIGGRRTFIVAYERLLTSARAAGAGVSWFVSLGRDQQHRLQAIEEAGRLGRLPQDEVERLAAPIRLALAAPTPEAHAIAGLLTRHGSGGDAEPPAGINRERWQQLRAEIDQRVGQARSRKEARLEVERAELERLKQDAAAALARKAAEADRHA